MKILASAFLALGLLVSSAFAQSADVVNLNKQVLAPTVRIVAGQASGSGTVVVSIAGKGTAILTNYHVVSSVIKGDDTSPARLMKTSGIVRVDFPVYNEMGEYLGVNQRQAKVLKVDKERDLAILFLLDPNVVPNVAKVGKDDTKTFIGEPAVIVGAALGDVPFIARGTMGASGFYLSGQEYLKLSIAINSGDSGGGIYKILEDGSYVLVGIPTAKKDDNTAYAIPLDAIRLFLKEILKDIDQ